MFADLPIFPEQASTHAESVDSLFFFLLAVTCFFSLLIAILIVVFAIKYRRRSDKDRPQPIEGSLKLEITWSVIPFILAMIMFFWGARVFFNAFRPPENSLEVFVVGKQWMWKVQHPGGQTEINQLHVPVGQPVKVTLISQDVIHNFSVPAFRLKQDVLPGRYTMTWFQATKIGSFHWFCNQYCGTNHSTMIGQVVVMSRADYQQWLNQGPDRSLAAKGGQLFRKLQCISCHAGDARARAPILSGVYGKTVRMQDGQEVMADDAYLRESILYPDRKIRAGYEPIMPTYEGQLDEEQIRQLLAFIKSLKTGDMIPRVENFDPPPPLKEPRKKNQGNGKK